MVPGVGYKKNAVGVDGYGGRPRKAIRGRTRRTVADQGRDRAVRGNVAQAMVPAIGEIDVVRTVDDHAGGCVQAVEHGLTAIDGGSGDPNPGTREYVPRSRDAANPVITGVGDENTAVGVHDERRTVQTGRGRRVAVAGEGCNAIAGDRTDDAVLADEPDPVIVGIGDVEVVLLVQKQAGRSAEDGFGGRTAVSAESGTVDTGYRRDEAVAVNAPDSVVVLVGYVKIAAVIQGQASGTVENGLGGGSPVAGESGCSAARYYGKLGGVGWLGSVTDGFIGRGADDDHDKALNLKLYGRPASNWFLSASLMRNGNTSASAILLGGSLLQPVGRSHFSTLGASPSDRIDAWLFQSDVQYGVPGKRVELTIGRGSVDYVGKTFDRGLAWFSVQGLYALTPPLYAAARYSEIGTHDDERGYHFGGEFLAGGNEAYGYDTKRFSRRSIGIGWRVNPLSTAKLEAGSDRFWVIDQSPAQPSNADRSYYALELAIAF